MFNMNVVPNVCLVYPMLCKLGSKVGRLEF